MNKTSSGAREAKAILIELRLPEGGCIDRRAEGNTYDCDDDLLLC